MQSDTPPSVEQFEGQNVAVVTVHYCAEPMPRPPREVVFSIDGNDIQLGQNWQNFLFEANTQNNTVPNCYFSRLKITPVHEDDQSRQIMLKLQNSYGVKQYVSRVMSAIESLCISGSQFRLETFSALMAPKVAYHGGWPMRLESSRLGSCFSCASSSA